MLDLILFLGIGLAAFVYVAKVLLKSFKEPDKCASCPMAGRCESKICKK